MSLLTPNPNNSNSFKPVALALVRRTFPALFANKVVGVQPMGNPVGLAYAMRVNYPETFVFKRYNTTFYIFKTNTALAMKITHSLHHALLNKNNEDEGIRELCIEVLKDRRLRCQDK
jgi:hypothetical protein